MKRILGLALCVGLLGASIAAAPASAYISTHDAFVKTFNYAKRACYHDSHCRQYGANACYRQNRGVACAAWNYEIYNHHKVACRKTLLWRGRHSKPDVLSNGWVCYRGWNHGPS